MAYSECLLTRLNPLAERTCFSQVHITHVPAIAMSNEGCGSQPSFEPIQAHHFTDLTGEYYANTHLSGAPFVTRAEPAINSNWFNYGPCGVPFGALGGPEDGCKGVTQPAPATFSVRWQGNITSDATTSTIFELSLSGGNGVPGTPHSPGTPQMGAKMWLDGKLITTSGTNPPHTGNEFESGGGDALEEKEISSSRSRSRSLSSTVLLKAGEPHTVKVEYWIADGLGSHPGFLVGWDQAGYVGNKVAVAAATVADATVLVVGGYQKSSGEGTDRAELSLPGTQQLDLVKAVHAATESAGKKLIVVFVSGKPIAEPWIQNNVDTIIHSWQAGQAQGTALARILFGLVNPSGRAAVSTPVSAATLPAYYSTHSSGSRSGWCDVGGSSILWAFGHGLSYTNYSYSNLVIGNADADAAAGAAIRTDSTVAVSCDIQNTGKVAGTEVVQVYVRDVVASVTTPKMALKAFDRVHLTPGEKRTVRMEINVAEQLKILNREFKWEVEPGLFKVWVGKASDNTQLDGAFNVTGS
jgi:hypothetical protein